MLEWGVAGQRTGKLIKPAAWHASLPDAEFRGLTEWVRMQPFDLDLWRWITEGRSGSWVALATVRPFSGMVTGAIVKVVPSTVAEEPNAVNVAYADSPPEFARDHLTWTRPVSPLPGIDRSSIQVQDVAHFGTATMAPLRDLVEDPKLARYCADILGALSTAWNPGPRDQHPSKLSVGRYLRDDLGGKADALRAFAEASGWDPDRPTTTIQLPGRAERVPNPLVYFGADARDGPEVEIFHGRGHGDLNVDNVLVPVDRGRVRAGRFRLIDLGRYSPVTSLSRDAAKLLLSVTSLWLPAMTPGSAIRSNLAELVVDPSTFPASPSIVGFLEVARKVWDSSAQWAVRRQLFPRWDAQRRATLAAAALRTVASGDLADVDRKWHMEVAALALRGFEAGDRTATDREVTSTASRIHVPAPRRQGERARTDVKDTFRRLLGADWQDLADVLRFGPHERVLFPAGNEAGYMWDLLVSRDEMTRLEPALTRIGRTDLVSIVRARRGAE